MQSRKTDLFFLCVICINLSLPLQTFFYFNDGNVERKYRDYKATGIQFKNFMEIFANSPRVDSVQESKQNFYELHAHLFIAFERIWQFYIRKGSSEMGIYDTVVKETMAILQEICSEEIVNIGEKNHELIKKYL
mmetsp:Transcript_28403/g.25130  ORF Transcript_28403/g.25130 Transcript_28403/m.25130 type:complete len:134 (-) Transcript_28403:33-434(-)